MFKFTCMVRALHVKMSHYVSLAVLDSPSSLFRKLRTATMSAIPAHTTNITAESSEDRTGTEDNPTKPAIHHGNTGDMDITVSTATTKYARRFVRSLLTVCATTIRTSKTLHSKLYSTQPPPPL